MKSEWITKYRRKNGRYGNEYLYSVSGSIMESLGATEKSRIMWSIMESLGATEKSRLF